MKVSEELFTYDPVGRILTVTDGEGATTTNTYDDLGRLIRVTRPVGGGQPAIDTSYGYNARRLHTLTVDGNNQDWWTTYNTWGLVEERTEPATTAHTALADRTFTTSYDAAGRADTEQQPGGNTVTRVFDDLGRLSSEQGGGAGGARSFVHDDAGRVVEFSTPAGAATASYNERGQLIATTGSTGVSQFDYDANGRMVERTDASGSTYYSWWPTNRLKNLTDPVTGTTRTYTWNTAGELELVDYGNGITRDYDWDNIGRLDSDTLLDGTSTMWSADYGYDDAHRLTSKVIAGPGVAGAGSNSYDYDDAGRLTQWTGPGSASPTAYTWDGNGNRTAAGASQFVYDERNRLQTETEPGAVTDYTWTARGTLDQTDRAQTTVAPIATDDFDEPDGLLPDTGLWDTTLRNGVVASIQNGRVETLTTASGQELRLHSTQPDPDTVDHDVAIDYQFSTNSDSNKAQLDIRLADSWDKRVWVRIKSNQDYARAYTYVNGTQTLLGTFPIDETTDVRRVR